MANEKRIKVGQMATVTFAWREDELPTEKNFFTGKVLQVIERNKGCFYARIQGLEDVVPLDRITPHNRRKIKRFRLVKLKRRRNYAQKRRNSLKNRSRGRRDF